jgi:hypothetical protein
VYLNKAYPNEAAVDAVGVVVLVHYQPKDAVAMHAEDVPMHVAAAAVQADEVPMHVAAAAAVQADDVPMHVAAAAAVQADEVPMHVAAAAAVQADDVPMHVAAVAVQADDVPMHVAPATVRHRCVPKPGHDGSAEIVQSPHTVCGLIVLVLGLAKKMVGCRFLLHEKLMAY